MSRLNLLALPPDVDPRSIPATAASTSATNRSGCSPCAWRKIIGLLQLNDRREGRFTPELIAFCETLAQNIGFGLQRRLRPRRPCAKANGISIAPRWSGRSAVGDSTPAATFSTWSDETHRIFGVPKGTPLTYETFLAHRVHPDDRAYVDEQWTAGLRGEPYDIEHRIVADGQVKWVREKAYLEFDAGGTLLGGFGITQDITARKRAEEELVRHAKAAEAANVAKSQFLANMSHEMRTPMTAILGLTDLALDEELSPTVRDYLETVEELVGNAPRTVERHPRFLPHRGRQGGRSKSAGSISAAWCRRPSRSSPSAPQSRRWRCGPTSPTACPHDLVGDPLRLRQVLINLIGNAVKFTERGRS